ncbi:MAG: GNAT family N-acetyltransferase [Actinobacteria bacterium]|nr:GNAT family N-acetyltransferase [Actinomycetota bacterium]
MRAELIEDGGAAGSDPSNFFRSPEFLAAEGVTHTVAIEGSAGTVALPVIVREIERSELRDAISPYGYPGAVTDAPDPLDPSRVDWSGTGLVSLFVRDRIGEAPCFAGGTVRAEVHIADPRAESGVRKRLREQIRRNERRGWGVAAEPGADAAEPDRRAFERAYADTMARTGAGDRYLLDSDYFERVLSAETAWLLLAGRDGEAPGAGAIAVTSDHLLHYFLGGTAEEALGDSPMKNLFAAMTSLAGELGLRLHLGGGVTPGDSLDGFKRGFANESAQFRTHEVVCDPAAYEGLRAARPEAPAGFFPAYRAPA